ncbi:MAG: hypothetical protein HFI33_07255 [Lachnospiraceae bacterium]|nr:hypothetical protein [Lachnospiraceae bacterium]
MYFLFILGGMLLFLMAGFYWLTGRWLALYGVPVKRWDLRLLRVGVVLFLLVLFWLWNTSALIALHLLGFFILTELVALGLRLGGKSLRERRWYLRLKRIYHSGMIAPLLTGLLLGYGAYNMGHIARTEYTVVSDKLQEDYKLVLITDTHYDTIQDPQVLKRKLAEINQLAPDLVVLGGDIVEENTSRESMEEAFQVLGSIKSRYGIYYVYGNHDRQLYRNSPAYTQEELAQAIEAGGIRILQDAWVPIGPDLILAGREDRGAPWGRASVAELLEGADRNRFLIVADHQPLEAEKHAAQGVDLQVSGHTHAGQVFPTGCLMEWMGQRNYGEYKEGNLRVIVSSGVAGWGFPVRTQEKCEYVVIHLRKTG